MIVIPEGSTFKYYSSVALASDLLRDDYFDVLDPLMDFVKLFETRLSIVFNLNLFKLIFYHPQFIHYRLQLLSFFLYVFPAEIKDGK